jgi:long-chain acyl-CoA synthetase
MEVVSHLKGKGIVGQDSELIPCHDSFTMSEPQPHTYNEMNESVKRTASGMRHLGLGRDGWRDEDGKERVGVYADTSMNWQIMSHSLARMGHPLTTAYTTLGPEGLQHSLHEPSVRLVFTNAGLLATLLKVIDECPTLLWVVYDKENEADQVRNTSQPSVTAPCPELI